MEMNQTNATIGLIDRVYLLSLEDSLSLFDFGLDALCKRLADLEMRFLK